MKYEKKLPENNLNQITNFGFRRVEPEEHKKLVHNVFDTVAGRYNVMNDLMSGGVHRVWKGMVLDRIAPRITQTLLDVAGGTGDIANGFLKRGGGDAIVYDINEQMLLRGLNKNLDHANLNGPLIACGDAALIPIRTGSIDACTIVFGLRNVTDREATLKELYRVLKIGGHFICLEFSPSVIGPLKRIYDAYSFKVIPWLGHKVAGDSEAYQYLAESIRRFPTPKELTKEMLAAGFKNITETPVTGGIVCMHSGWRV
ncbi:MAG: class I SAM-dependent methyltransferase [Pseudomonadota bacterium]|nr:class I SAM-dependent methyltransferase [Pseudomonadota bacterium]